MCGLRAVTSVDGMTADIYPFAAAFLSGCATRIINEVKGINRVVYDYISMPPGTKRTVYLLAPPSLLPAASGNAFGKSSRSGNLLADVGIRPNAGIGVILAIPR